VVRATKEFVHFTGEFEKQVKKLCLDPKVEEELIEMINKVTGEDHACAANQKKDARILSGTKNGSTPIAVAVVHNPP
jgi:hypothetical protein